MNLPAPNPSCESYTQRLYQFLQNPIFDAIRLGPRASDPETALAGQLYYNTDDGFQVGDGASFSSISGSIFVPREYSDFDFVKSSSPPVFVNNNAWYDLDLSSIVTDTDAKAVLLYVKGVTVVPTEGSCIFFKAKGDTEDEINTVWLRKPYHYLMNEQPTVNLPSDGSRVIQYNIKTASPCAGVAWSEMNVVVYGWWV